MATLDDNGGPKIRQYSVETAWEIPENVPEEETNMVTFCKGAILPKGVNLTFYRMRPFQLIFQYTQPSDRPGPNIPRVMARCSI